MKKIFSFLLLIALCANSSDLFASSSRLWAAGPIARNLYSFLHPTPPTITTVSRSLSTNSASPATLHIPKSNISLLNGYKYGNAPKFMSNQITNQASKKWPLVPSLIAATLVLFETKHLITSYYREAEATMALKQAKNEPWTEEKQFAFEEITKKFQHTDKGAEQQKQLKILQEKVIPLYLIFKRDGAEKFLHEMLTTYSNREGIKFRNSPEYKDMFKKFTPKEKQDLLSTIEDRILNKENELQELTTEPGWFWTRRPKENGTLSRDEIRAVQDINKELEILKQTKNIIEQS